MHRPTNTEWGPGAGPILPSEIQDPAIKRRLVAIGGGGFGGSASLGGIERYLRSLLNPKRPKIVALMTASGDSDAYTERLIACGDEFDFEPVPIPLFRPSEWREDPWAAIASAEMIYVGGGNTFNMLTLWREWGIIPALRSAYLSGTLVAGVSAGAICWFEQGNTDSLAPSLEVLDGLGWLSGSCTPHFHGESSRIPALVSQLKTGRIRPGIAIDDHACARFENEVLCEVFCEADGAGAFHVSSEPPHFSPVALSS